MTHHIAGWRRPPLPKGAHHIGIGPAWPRRSAGERHSGPRRRHAARRSNSNLTPQQQVAAAQEVGQEVEEATANTEGFNFSTRLLFYAPGAGALRFSAGSREDDPAATTTFPGISTTTPPAGPKRIVTRSDSGSRKPEPTHILKSATVNTMNLYEGKEIIGRGVQRPNIPAHAENYRVASV